MLNSNSYNEENRFSHDENYDHNQATPRHGQLLYQTIETTQNTESTQMRQPLQLDTKSQNLNQTNRKTNLRDLEENRMDFGQRPSLQFQIYKFDKQRNLTPYGDQETIEGNINNPFNFYFGSNPKYSQKVLIDKQRTISNQHALIKYDREFGWLLYDGLWEGQNQVKPSSNGSFVQLNDFERLQDQRQKSLSIKIFDNMIFNLSGYQIEVKKF